MNVQMSFSRLKENNHCNPLRLQRIREHVEQSHTIPNSKLTPRRIHRGYRYSNEK